VSSAVTVLRDGLDRDERLIFLGSEVKVAHVREALGDDANEVSLVPTDEHGRNPGRITTLLDSFRSAGDGRRSLGVIENVYATRTPHAQAEAHLTDSALNSPSLQAWPMSIICMFDAGALDAAAVAELRRAHPIIRGEADPNRDYDARHVETLYDAVLPSPPEDAAALDVTGPQLGDMREFVRTFADQQHVAPDRVDDLVLAANEIGTNSVRHGGGRCTVRMWSTGESVICEVTDAGHIRDPLVGRFAPPPDAASGRGLWLANHLCDLVQIRSSRRGTVVRLHVDR
jgi:anti-sigma regulatory factor (Ser/Thr protein kinase)